MNTKKLLTYALNSENQLKNIDEVPNGLECNCICPGCKEPLIAKNEGKIREHHFAHTSDSECVLGYQTMIHLLTKDIIEEMKIFPMALNGKFLSACEVYKEVSLIKELGIIPDILGFTPITDGPNIVGKIPIIVEIYVTHKVDEEKANILKKSGIPSVEIDLSKTEVNTKNELIQEIYNPKNWKIINGNIRRQFLPQINLSLPAYYGAYPRRTSYSSSRSHYKRNNSGYSHYSKKRR